MAPPPRHATKIAQGKAPEARLVTSSNARPLVTSSDVRAIAASPNAPGGSRGNTHVPPLVYPPPPGVPIIHGAVPPPGQHAFYSPYPTTLMYAPPHAMAHSNQHPLSAGNPHLHPHAHPHAHTHAHAHPHSHAHTHAHVHPQPHSSPQQQPLQIHARPHPQPQNPVQHPAQHPEQHALQHTLQHTQRHPQKHAHKQHEQAQLSQQQLQSHPQTQAQPHSHATPSHTHQHAQLQAHTLAQPHPACCYPMHSTSAPPSQPPPMVTPSGSPLQPAGSMPTRSVEQSPIVSSSVMVREHYYGWYARSEPPAARQLAVAGDILPHP
eukprot:IDg19406t1